MDALRRKAFEGDMEAQFSLACCFESGDGIMKDQAAAVLWYWAAVEQGHTRAMLILGIRYAQGWDVSEDKEQAARLYLRAAHTQKSDGGGSVVSGGCSAESSQSFAGTGALL